MNNVKHQVINSLTLEIALPVPIPIFSKAYLSLQIFVEMPNVFFSFHDDRVLRSLHSELR